MLPELNPVKLQPGLWAFYAVQPEMLNLPLEWATIAPLKDPSALSTGLLMTCETSSGSRTMATNRGSGYAPTWGLPLMMMGDPTQVAALEAPWQKYRKVRQ